MASLFLSLAQIKKDETEATEPTETPATKEESTNGEIATTTATETTDETAESEKPVEGRKRKRRGFSDANPAVTTPAEATSTTPVAIGTLLPPGALLPTPPVAVTTTTATATPTPTPTPTPAVIVSKTSLPDLSDALKAKLQAAKAYAVQQTVDYRKKLDVLRVQSNQALMMQHNLAAKQRAYQLMARVYVGSLFYSTTADAVKAVFQQFGTIKTTDLPWDPATGAHKGYCFVEYDCPEASQMSIEAMNGQMLDGRSIKCGRPNSAPQARPVIEEMMNDPRNKTRIYVANIHPELGESDIKSVFESFGPVVSCKLCPDPVLPGKHKSFGFIEYNDETAAKEAIDAMNVFDLGGQFLRVCKAITLPEYAPFLQGVPTNSNANTNIVAAANVAASVAQKAGLIGTGEGDDDEKKDDDETDEDGQISGTSQRFMMMQKLAEKQKDPTVVLLKNMVEKEDIDDDLEEEVSEECEKCGKVDKVVIFEELVEIENYTAVKIFVNFVEPESVEKCVTLMNGRWFGGKQIICEPYDQQLFETGDYTN